jgi:hypothetical protein
MTPASVVLALLFRLSSVPRDVGRAVAHVAHAVDQRTGSRSPAG